MAFNSFKSKNVCTEYFRKNLENLWKITFIINTRLDSRHNFKLKFDGYSNNIKNMVIIFKTMENGTLAKSIICYWLWLYLFQIWWNFDEIWQLDRSRWVDYEVFWHFFKISTLKRDIDGLEIDQNRVFRFITFEPLDHFLTKFSTSGAQTIPEWAFIQNLSIGRYLMWRRYLIPIKLRSD